MKKIMAKTGEYTNGQGEQKAQWTKIGIINSNQNGEYIILEPTVSLGGVLAAQNAMSNQPRSGVMCSIFEDEPKQQGQQRQQAPQQQRQQPQQQAPNDYDQSIPF